MSLIKKFRYEIIFFLVFCLARAPFLGNELFNTDVWKWKARIYDFGSGVFQLDFNKTLQKYHPGVTLMWLGTTAIKFQGLYCAIITCPDEAINPTEAVFALHFFQKLFVVVAIGLILTVTFYPLRMLFGKRYAYVTLFLLSFEPFFYALTRVIHLEGLMTALMLASFVWLFYSLEKTQEKRQQIAILPVALSAIFGGLAILTKSSALFLVPFSLGVLFYYQNKNRRQALRLVVVWVSLVVATYFTLWPSMWVQPLKTLDYVFVRGIMETGLEGEHGQIFLRQYTENPGPAYYLVIAGYKFSPFLVTGIILFLFRKKDIFASFGGEKAKRFALLTAIFTLGYLIEITIPTKKLDRYILPALASVSLLAGFSYTWLIAMVIKKAWRSAALALFLIILAFQSLALTPDYFSYYSPIFGGLSRGIFAIEPKWLIGQRQLTWYFYDLKKQKGLDSFNQGESLDNQEDLSHKLVIAFPEKYYTQIWPFIKRMGVWATIEDLTGDARKSDYFVYPVWHDYSSEETRFKLMYVDSVYLRGVKLYNIYQRYDL